ncbi:hypothetical protein HZH68_003519 [Vespula germanica]|uniref:Uncharacterized protein n=1 Tax=Vespula germanica TaxID=30212 RepID=A0A834NPA2_VESGE|nr:hypothetical protein HZH68_003519 [Vespula germanica]
MELEGDMAERIGRSHGMHANNREKEDFFDPALCMSHFIKFSVTSAFEVYASTRSLLVGISEHEEGEEEEEEDEDEEDEEEEEEGKEEKSSGFTIYLPIMYR